MEIETKLLKLVDQNNLLIIERNGIILECAFRPGTHLITQTRMGQVVPNYKPVLCSSNCPFFRPIENDNRDNVEKLPIAAVELRCTHHLNVFTFEGNEDLETKSLDHGKKPGFG